MNIYQAILLADEHHEWAMKQSERAVMRTKRSSPPAWIGARRPAKHAVPSTASKPAFAPSASGH